MWWNLKFFRPEPLLGFVPKIKITYQCSAMFVKPKQKPNSELKAHWASFCHHIAKRNVGRCIFSLDIFLFQIIFYFDLI
jgi:hypothetical protein